MPSKLIEQARTSAGLTQQEMAERAGTSRTTLSAYEHGRKSPNLETFERLLVVAGYEVQIQHRIKFSKIEMGRGRPIYVPDRLWRLDVSEAFEPVVLNLALNWSQPGKEYITRDRRQRTRLYETVIREGMPKDILKFVEQGLSLALDDNQLSSESAAQLLGLFANLLSQLEDRLKFVNGKSVYIKYTVELINCIKTAVIFENTLKPFYDGVVLLPGSQKTLVDFITMGADFVKISIDYDSFFKEISFERMSIDRYLSDCEENATKTMGSQLSPIAAKRRFEHVAMIPGIIRAIASYIRNGIGAACDDVFTGTLQVEISKRLSAIACYESDVQKAFAGIRSSDLIEEAAINYASAISAKEAKKPAAQENISFVHIAKISRDLCASEPDSSKKSPQRTKEPLKIELFCMTNYNGNLLCTSCNVRTASTNKNPQNGPIGVPLFPINDDKNHFIGGLCQMCAYCVSNNNNWKTIVPMTSWLIKGFFPFTNKSFEAKKIAIYEMRKAHLNCNRCKAVNGRVFDVDSNELKFGAYCLNCVTEVYRGMHGYRPSSRINNQELLEDFNDNKNEYIKELKKPHVSA
ncbi:XRE family transcriptional regulator [bacterium]|nr:XRE family transcriptional regulator [bacterium]